MIGYIVIFIVFVVYITWKNISGYQLLDYINKFYPNSKSEYYSTNIEWCENLRHNYKTIVKEYKDYISNNELRSFKQIDNVQSSYDISDIPWKVLFLRAYNKDTSKIKHFPKTYNLISKIPGCTLAMFSVLPPGKHIPPHEGPYKGVLRYHLGLIVPEDYKKCSILVNGKQYNWKTGCDVLFDDTFKHSVTNDTDQTRVVLFLDIQRRFNNIFLDFLNSIVLYTSQFHKTTLDIVQKTDN